MALPRPTQPRGLDQFLLMDPPWAPSHAALLTRRALCLYAAYMTINRARRSPDAHAADIWEQAYKEGVASAPGLAECIRVAGAAGDRPARA